MNWIQRGSAHKWGIFRDDELKYCFHWQQPFHGCYRVRWAIVKRLLYDKSGYLIPDWRTDVVDGGNVPNHIQGRGYCMNKEDKDRVWQRIQDAPISFVVLQQL